MKYFCVFCQKNIENNISHNENCPVMNMTKEQQLMITKVMGIAVSAIYFNDSSDYLPALKNIVNTISPEIYNQIDSDERKAFVRTNLNGKDYNE